METYTDPELFNVLANKDATRITCKMSNQKGIILEGFLVLNQFANDSELMTQAKDNLYGIQNIFQKEFPFLDISGGEMTYPINPTEDHGVRYSGIINGKLDEINPLRFCTDLHARINNLPARQKFQAKLQFLTENQLGEDGSKATLNALERMWPYILGINDASPAQYGPNFHPGHIVLYEDGNAIATGDAVFEKLNLKLPSKPLLLESGY